MSSHRVPAILTICLTAVLAALSWSCAMAQAMPQIGISQSYRDAGLNFPQNPTYNSAEDVFNSADWAPLQIRYARAVIAYDVASRAPSDHRRIEFENWLTRTRQLGMEPFVVLGPSENHVTNDGEAFVAPYSSAYTTAVQSFLKLFGPKTEWDVRVIGAWNEPNFSDPGVPGGPKGPVHLPQSTSPFYSSTLLSDRPSGSCSNTTSCGPMMAAYYWLDARNAMKTECPNNVDPNGKTCAVVAGEFDSDGSTSSGQGYWDPYATSFSQAAFEGNKPQWLSFHGWSDANPGTNCSPSTQSSCITHNFWHWQQGLGGSWAQAQTWDTEVGSKIGTGEEDQSKRLNQLITVSGENHVSRLYYYNFQSRAEEDAGLIDDLGEHAAINTHTRQVWNTFRCRISCTAPPGAETYSGSATSSSQAFLIGVVNSAGSATTYHFEYGTTAAYGTSTSGESAGSGTDPITEDASINGLQPGTTYHFRFVATNAAGTSDGQDQVFTTPPF